ncbi:Translocon-associated protein delta subunit [Paragonimus heterotremus]|uniref:Translocon-associated protein subunit delta n=1 Tax=Paragonimus heterotremus TaxID=100268 RepID=A0A8J4TGX5_9TREM|nr:Translocon-associated protein delta subunit [Paragonimus heterotremus]
MTSFILLFVCCFSAVYSCSEFDTRTVAFSSKESVLSTRTVVVVEGEAKCRAKGTSDLYAELNGVLQPVSRNPETDSFQVTFVFEHKHFPKGEYSVNFFNEQGAAAFRRSLKGVADSSSTPVFTVTVKHKGIQTTPWVYTETLVLLTISTITLGAFITKHKSF